MVKHGTALLLALLVLGAMPQLSAPALAGPKGKHKKSASEMSRHRTNHVAVDLYDTGGGPPPWAPAHGYRRKHGGEAVAYVAPFGIHVGTCNRQLLGAALGGTAGGLLAAEIADGEDRAAAIAGGAILGALLGGAIGDSMDRLDQSCVGQILEHTPSREAVAWENPDRGASYQVTPTRTYQDDGGRYCREYQTTVTIGGKPEQAYGNACRQPDGSWQRVS